MELLEEDLTCPICCSLFDDPGFCLAHTTLQKVLRRDLRGECAGIPCGDLLHLSAYVPEGNFSNRSQ